MVASRGALGLITVSLVGVVAVAAWYGRPVWEDSGAFAFVMFGLPLVCAAAALGAERGIRSLLATVVVGVAGLISTAWALITAMGAGLALAPFALVLLVAAMVSGADRRKSTESSHT